MNIKVQVKSNFSFIVLIILIAVTTVSGQPTGNAISTQNQSREARRIYAEAEVLFEIESEEKQFEALGKFRKAHAIFQQIGDRKGEAQTLFHIGYILYSFGENADAKKNAVEAIVKFQKIGELLWEGKASNLLGLIFADLGNYKNALTFYNNALAIFKKIDDFDEAIPTINNIGRVHEELGEYEKALWYYNLALPYLEETGNSLYIALTHDNIGGVYWKKNEPTKALVFYERAFRIFQSTGNKNREANSLNNIGTAYIKLEQYPKALEYLNQSLINSKATGRKTIEAIVLSNLMVIWEKLNNKETAVFYGKQSINKYQELRAGAKNLDLGTQRLYLQKIQSTYRILAELLIENGRFEQAKEVLEMLKEEEFSEFVRRDADEIKSLARRVALSEKEKNLLERYSALADRTARTSADFQKLDEKKRLLEQRGESLSPAEDAEYKKLSAELADVNAAFKLFLEKELIKEISRENLRKIELDRALQERLRRFGRETVVISTVVTDERYRVILTTPTVQIDAKTDIKTAELNRKIFNFRAALQDSTVDPRPAGKELYDILLKPIEKSLQDSGAQTLVWSLDGVLRYIPLAALSPDGETYLIEKYRTVILTPQTRDDLDEIKPDWKLLGMGVSTAQKVFYPDFPDEAVELEPLPAVEEELKTLVREDRPDEKGILAGRRFLNNDFTLKNLTDSLTKTDSTGRKEFNAVHLASHFRLAANWSDSFLLIGDGRILTLEQIANSPQIDFSDVELVTLSACNTASGIESNGGEIDGLAGLIQTKNGKSVLATLWEVEDQSTALLMNNFYRLRKENPNLTKAEALQKAQKQLLYGGETAAAKMPVSPTGKFRRTSARPFAHPVYWSPFVLFGNWR